MGFDNSPGLAPELHFPPQFAADLQGPRVLKGIPAAYHGLPRLPTTTVPIDLAGKTVEELLVTLTEDQHCFSYFCYSVSSIYFFS